MNKMLFTIAILIGLSFPVAGQSVSGPSITLTSSSGAFHSLAQVTATGRNFCPFPTFFGGPYTVSVKTSDGLVQPARTYECTSTRLRFAIPIIQTQILDITISAGFFSEKIVFVAQPTVPAAPVIEAIGTVSVSTRTVRAGVGAVSGGLFTLPEPTTETEAFFILQGSGFGNTKTYAVIFFDLNGTPLKRPDGLPLEVVAQVFPPSSGLTIAQFTFSVPVEWLPGVPFQIEGRYAGDQSIVTNRITLRPVN